MNCQANCISNQEKKSKPINTELVEDPNNKKCALKECLTNVKQVFLLYQVGSLVILIAY